MTIYITFWALLLYLALTIYKVGIPPSLSASFYLLNEKRKGLGYLFIPTLMIAGFGLIPTMLDITPESVQFLGFFPGMFLCFVGAAPAFATIDAKVHYIAAGLSALLSIVWMAVVMPFSLLVMAGVACMIGILMLETKTKRAWLFWLEIIIFGSLILTLIYKPCF